MQNIQISPNPLTYKSINEILQSNVHLTLSEESRHLIQHCREFLDKKIESQTEPIYGITTGFGSLCNISISTKELTRLQENLVKSHACGLGDKVPVEIVKLMLFLKVHALALGYSGVQVSTVQRIIDFFNEGIYPVIYEQGSLGASGDLAPLAHLSLPLLGLGEFYYKGEIFAGQELERLFGWKPIELQAKEGLALLNGTQFMSAYSAYSLLKAFRLIRFADISGTLSLEAYNGRIEPFLHLIHQVRPHRGQVETARNVRKLLVDSELIKLHGKAVQDPYSYRCIPQVHGAAKDAIRHVASVVLTEVNSVTDNPTLFPFDDLILSGGNFHGEPLALSLDFMSIALAEIGNISERRVYRLISGQRGLPPFLVANPGINSGFMIPQYTDASLVSQNKQLCTPSSVDSITSSNEQEDHVSMGANAATKTLRVVKNLEKILAIEWFAACQAIEFRRPGKTSTQLEKTIQAYRLLIPFISEDEVMFSMINKTCDFIFDPTLDEMLNSLEFSL